MFIARYSNIFFCRILKTMLHKKVYVEIANLVSIVEEPQKCRGEI